MFHSVHFVILYSDMLGKGFFFFFFPSGNNRARRAGDRGLARLLCARAQILLASRSAMGLHTRRFSPLATTVARRYRLDQLVQKVQQLCRIESAPPARARPARRRCNSRSSARAPPRRCSSRSLSRLTACYPYLLHHKPRWTLSAMERTTSAFLRNRQGGVLSENSDQSGRCCFL